MGRSRLSGPGPSDAVTGLISGDSGRPCAATPSCPGPGLPGPPTASASQASIRVHRYRHAARESGPRARGFCRLPPAQARVTVGGPGSPPPHPRPPSCPGRFLRNRRSAAWGPGVVGPGPGTGPRFRARRSRFKAARCRTGPALRTHGPAGGLGACGVADFSSERRLSGRRFSNARRPRRPALVQSGDFASQLRRLRSRGAGIDRSDE